MHLIGRGFLLFIAVLFGDVDYRNIVDVELFEWWSYLRSSFQNEIQSVLSHVA